AIAADYRTHRRYCAGVREISAHQKRIRRVSLSDQLHRCVQATSDPRLDWRKERPILEQKHSILPDFAAALHRWEAASSSRSDDCAEASMLRTQIIRPGKLLRVLFGRFCAVIDVGGCCDLFAPGSAVIDRFAQLI